MFISSYCRYLAASVIPLCLLLGFQAAHGADIAYKIRQGNDTSVSLELGLALLAADIPVVGWVGEDPEDPTAAEVEVGLLIEGRANWRGLFVETNLNSFSIFAMGFTPWSNDSTSVDLVFSDGLGEYEPGIGAFESVNYRKSDFVAGIRATHHFDKTLLQLEGYSDISGQHDGQMLALQLGRFRQIRNWNLHGLLGARYFSDSMVDYYFGITEEESTADIPSYEASGGILASLEIGVTLPLTEKWLFKSTVEGLYLPDSILDSPLVEDKVGFIASTALSYVF